MGKIVGVRLRGRVGCWCCDKLERDLRNDKDHIIFHNFVSQSFTWWVVIDKYVMVSHVPPALLRYLIQFLVGVIINSIMKWNDC